MELCKTALAARYAQEAKTASERAQAAAVHPPVIGGNGNWQIWDQGSGAYVDSGLRAAGPAGEQGPQGEAGNYTKPAAGIPEEDLSQAVRNKLNSGGASDYADLNNKPGINGVTLSGNKTAAQLGLAAADDVPTKTSQLQNDAGFLTQHQSLAAYRTAAAQDMIDAGKQAKIAASGMLKGDGNGGVSTAVPETDYLAPSALAPYRTAAAQDVIDAGKAPLASPSLTGTPTAPTAAQGANSQQIATTAYADAALSNFAYVNSGDTADKAYTANELLVYKGQLYKASAAIAIGETLTPDSNITLRTIATALQNLHLKYTSLFDGGITEYTNYTLSDSLANYDIVIAEIYTQDNERKAYCLLPVLNKKYDVSWNATDSVSWYIICTIQFTANTTLNVLKCTKRGFSQSNLQIYGIRIV